MNVNVNYLGRLGNNMFQYAFTSLALSKFCENDPNMFSIHSIPTTDQLNEIRNKEARLTDNVNMDFVRYGHYPVTHHITDYGHMEGAILSLDEIADKLVGIGTTLYFDGYFQHKSYYEGKRDFLKSLFTPAKPKGSETAIHIRLTDYKDIGWSLPESYYNEAISLANPSVLNVFTDEPNHSYIQKLKSHGANVICGDPVGDLLLMASHEKIIMSRSSYSWWAAVLSSATDVYYPKPKTGFWSEKMPHKDVAVNDPTFRFIEF